MAAATDRSILPIVLLAIVMAIAGGRTVAGGSLHEQAPDTPEGAPLLTSDIHQAALVAPCVDDREACDHCCSTYHCAIPGIEASGAGLGVEFERSEPHPKATSRLASAPLSGVDPPPKQSPLFPFG